MPSLSANGVTLNYRLEGPEGAPVVAFSNSLGTTLAMWDRQAEALSDRYRVLRYDTRGHGGSSEPTGPFEVQDLAADLAALLHGLGIGRAHVVGLSLGGMTGQALAATRPELVDRLVLVATAAAMAPASAWQERADLVRRDGPGAVAAGAIGRWFTPAGQGTPEAAETRRQFETEVSPEGYAGCCEAISRMDLRPVIGRITAPTLVIAGADDPATPPAMSEEISGLIPGSRLVVMPNAAHLIAVERPAELTAAITSFLEESRA